jgi:exodeoxyribonuclease-3
MKITTWNVNSIRVRLPHVVEYLSASQPDILCLQELKCESQAFPYADIQALGYQAYVLGQKSYNGVALLSRMPLTDLVYGLNIDDSSPEARMIAGRWGSWGIVCVYVPNGQDIDSPKFAFKMAWLQHLKTFLKDWQQPGQPLLIAGDFNVASRDVDVARPDAWKKGVLCCPAIREAWQAFCLPEYTDILAEHYPEGGKYSWWDYRRRAWPRNDGLRIDGVLANAQAFEHVVAAGIDTEYREKAVASDHAPVWITLGVGGLV